MPSIVDVIKEKHPEATGSTIADVIRTSESGGSGGSKNNQFVITLSYDSDSAKYVVDKTTEEIESAYQAAKLPIVRLDLVADEMWFRFVNRSADTGGYTYAFAAEPTASAIYSGSATTVGLAFGSVIIRPNAVEFYTRTATLNLD